MMAGVCGERRRLLAPPTTTSGSRPPKQEEGLRVIFLDCDGVLANSRSACWDYEPGDETLMHDPSGYNVPIERRCMSELQRVAQATGAVVVLSTTWRLVAEMRDFLVASLKEYGLQVIGDTPAGADTSNSGHARLLPKSKRLWGRGAEVAAWLAAQGEGQVESFVILDDDHVGSFEQADLSHALVQTTMGGAPSSSPQGRLEEGLTPELADQTIRVLLRGAELTEEHAPLLSSETCSKTQQRRGVRQAVPKQRFRYLVILDFEATCDDGGCIPHDEREIIEVPALLLDLQQLAVIAEFHSFVRPVQHPVLTEFCSELTGIQQAQVDAAPTLPEVLAALTAWLATVGVGLAPLVDPVTKRPNFAFATCGDWDFQSGLPSECARKGLELPWWAGWWVNMKVSFKETYALPRKKDMTNMLSFLKMPLIGHHHSGIDDSRNIAALCIRMAQDGCCFKATGGTVPKSVWQLRAPGGMEPEPEMALQAEAQQEPEPKPEPQVATKVSCTAQQLVRRCRVLYTQLSRQLVGPTTAHSGNVLASLDAAADAALAASSGHPVALLCKGWLAIQRGQPAVARELLEQGLERLHAAGKMGGTAAAETVRLLGGLTPRQQPVLSEDGCGLIRTLSQRERDRAAAADAAAQAARVETQAMDAELNSVQAEVKQCHAAAKQATTPPPSPPRVQLRVKVKGAKLLPHEEQLLRAGAIAETTHAGATSIWLTAPSTQLTEGSPLCAVYRPMGDLELKHLLSNGVLPDTQPYQTIVEGEAGRRYAEKYLRGAKKPSPSRPPGSTPTTVVEFVVPRELVEQLFAMQSKIEDGVLSHGLGDKGGGGLPLFNACLRRRAAEEGVAASFRIVLVKRSSFERRGATDRKQRSKVDKQRTAKAARCAAKGEAEVTKRECITRTPTPIRAIVVVTREEIHRAA
eukprot:COSAG01_NODE_6817_length_3485_cov_42.916716_1_plen_918_part_01